MRTLDDLRAKGKRVVGYGATSKSTTVTNYCGITPDHVEFISDTTPIKQGKLSPGAHIPVEAYTDFVRDYPAVRALLFAWNHAAEIRARGNRLHGCRWKMDRLRPGCGNRLLIPLASPLAQYRAHKNAIQAAIARVLESGTYILGEEGGAPSSAASPNYCGGRHAVGVGSGTDALILALKALGIGAGDDVVTVSHTAVATVAAILACGAQRRFSSTSSPPSTRSIQRRSKRHDGANARRSSPCISTGSLPTWMRLSAIARRHGLPRHRGIVPRPLAALYRGRRSAALVILFALASIRPRIRARSAMPRHGRSRRTPTLRRGSSVFANTDGTSERQTREVGLNSRLDPLQAAVLRAKLPHLDVDNARRAAIARRYSEGLAGLYHRAGPTSRHNPLFSSLCRSLRRARRHAGASCQPRDRFCRTHPAFRCIGRVDTRNG